MQGKNQTKTKPVKVTSNTAAQEAFIDTCLANFVVIDGLVYTLLGLSSV